MTDVNPASLFAHPPLPAESADGTALGVSHFVTLLDSLTDAADDISMDQLTLRGFDDELRRVLKTLAQREGISLNQAALRLLRRGAGLADGKRRQDVVGDSLDHLIGAWSDAEAHRFAERVRELDVVDKSLWS